MTDFKSPQGVISGEMERLLMLPHRIITTGMYAPSRVKALPRKASPM